jgi:hypothetical protein
VRETPLSGRTRRRALPYSVAAAVLLVLLVATGRARYPTASGARDGAARVLVAGLRALPADPRSPAHLCTAASQQRLVLAVVLAVVVLVSGVVWSRRTGPRPEPVDRDALWPPGRPRRP